LLSNLRDVSFSYYGWRSIDEKSDNPDQRFKSQWLNEYSGIDRQYMPSKIILSIEKEYTLIIPVELQVDVEKWLSPYFNSDT